MRKGHIAVLGSLAPVDVDHHAFRVNVGYFQVLSFLEPQTTGVHGAEEGVVLGSLDTSEQLPDFLDTEDRGEPVFGLGSEDVEDMPVLLKDVLVEEADTAIADPHRTGGPLADVLAVKEVVLEFTFGDLIGTLPVELDQHAHSPGVSLLRSFPFAVELKGLDKSFIPVCHHDTSPFIDGFREA
jgi:hypothetical protein